MLAIFIFRQFPPMDEYQEFVAVQYLKVFLIYEESFDYYLLRLIDLFTVVKLSSFSFLIIFTIKNSFQL